MVKNYNHVLDSGIEAHKGDNRNILLGYQSVSAADAHIHIDATYYPALNQVIICEAFSGRNTSTSYKRIDIPMGITEKEDLIAYAAKIDPSISMICKT